MKKSGAPNIRVFVSYSHDTPEHKKKALEFTQRLRGNNINAVLDQFEEFPPQGWPNWMARQIKIAHFVLVVCTVTYRKRFEGYAKRGKGAGAKFEGSIITQAIFEQEQHNRKFVPVVFSTIDAKHRPTPLRPYTYFDVSDEIGFESLYRLLTGQPKVTPAPLGAKKTVDTPRKIAHKAEGDQKHTAPSVTSGRLAASVAMFADESGTTIRLDVANISSYPVFIETPTIVFVHPPRMGRASRKAKVT